MPLLTLLAAASVTVVQPSGRWNVEAQQNVCTLSRQYGEGAATFVVGFQPLFNSETMELFVITPARWVVQEIGTATVTPDPDGNTLKGSYFSIPVKDGRRFTQITLERALFDELAATTALRIKAGSTAVTVAVPRFEKARPVFQKCETDLLTEWGVDPATLTVEHQTQPPRDLFKYFNPKNYPVDALSRGNIGRVRAILKIDATGKVTDCRPIVSAGKSLNEATCARARLIPFTAATDAAGKPVPSIFVMNVRWDIG